MRRRRKQGTLIRVNRGRRSDTLKHTRFVQIRPGQWIGRRSMTVQAGFRDIIPHKYLHNREKINGIRRKVLSAAANERFPESRPYEARGAALMLWKSKEEELLIEGPAGTGKTRGILEKFHFCAMKYPGCRLLIVRKTRESMTQTVLVTFEEKVVQAEFSVLEGPQRNLRSVYRYPNGSEIVVGGLDKSTKVMSSEYDMIGVFEATELTEEDFENLTTRLRNGVMPYQQIVADCNPGAPQHWLNQRPRTKKMRRLLSRHVDNPVYFHKNGTPTSRGEQYLKKLKRLSGHRRLRLYKGIWAAAEGMVYPNWDPDVHHIDPFKVPADWRRIRSIDFGYVNPFVCQWWAISPDGEMYLYREIYMTKRLVGDHAKLIHKYSQGENYEVTITDHDAGDRATLERMGIYSQPAFKEVTPGIEAVNARLYHHKRKKVKPRLFIMRDCRVEMDPELKDAGLPTCTAEEFEGYSYPKKVEGKTPKEEPVKKDDHGMDAKRYAVAYVDNVHGMIVKVGTEEIGTVFSEAA